MQRADVSWRENCDVMDWWRHFSRRRGNGEVMWVAALPGCWDVGTVYTNERQGDRLFICLGMKEGGGGMGEEL